MADSIHSHSILDPTTITQSLALLRPHLPTSLPLYRRLQQGRFFDSTKIFSNLPSLSPEPESSQQPWLLAFIDRSSRPETEVWMFGSWESQSTMETETEAILKNLILKIKELPLPTSIHQESEPLPDGKDFSGTSRAEYAAHMADANIMLFGAIHSSTAKLFERIGVVKNVFEKTALVPNHTYLFTRSGLPKLQLQLHKGLRWGELERKHFALVRSRTFIPRQERTLAILGNVAIFERESDAPIAWAFIGLDGSLSTLHVEEEWRGRGLAKMVAVKLFEEKMAELWEEGVTDWAHGYVIEGNRASCGVCEAVGGKRGWDAFWVRGDLSAI